MGKWKDAPVSRIYQMLFDKLKEREKEKFKGDIAIRSIAKAHTENVKDVIDEDMGKYDTEQLNKIVERCVAKYVKLEDENE